MNEIVRIEPGFSDPCVVPALPAAKLPELPGAREAITIRPGVLNDYAFIDALQKRHSKAVGFMFEAAIKGHLEKGHVLVAEAAGSIEPQRHGRHGGLSEGEEEVSSGCARTAGRMPTPPMATTGETPIPPQGSSPTPNTQNPTPAPVGYLIGVDRYLKRDELGVIYQVNVVPAYQRSLVAANLLKAQFDRSAYGCRLYCCWCAQDLAANRFWEAMGFVPLAFRTGGRGRGGKGSRGRGEARMHIFWQTRIRRGDDFPYWFPSQPGAGAIGEDRLVLPIPPGTHWSDAKPVVLPEGSVNEEALLLEERVGALEKQKKGLNKKGPRGQGRGESDKAKARQVKSVAAGGLHFGPRPPEVLTEAEAEANAAAAAASEAVAAAAAIEAELKEVKQAARKAKKKFDPAQEAFARELKDRWLEAVAARPGLLAAAPGAARYDVTRGIQAAVREEERVIKRLDAA